MGSQSPVSIDKGKARASPEAGAPAAAERQMAELQQEVSDKASVRIPLPHSISIFAMSSEEQLCIGTLVNGASGAS